VSTQKVRVTRLIRAHRDKVFAAWLQPELLRQWFCPEELTVESAEVDPRVGGRFRAVMKGEGETHTVNATYREITAGRRIVFTHTWEEQDSVETLVTVEFADKNGGTEITVTHEGFVDAEQAKGHEAGWSSTLEHLAKHVE
jgi:uncharacterized protein YndB with AHSA1/START domain